MRPIDADALKKKKVRSTERCEWVVPVAEIDWMPTVTLKQSEQKTGKWIKTYRNGFGNLIGHCNKCGRSASVDNYCPNCGSHNTV